MSYSFHKTSFFDNRENFEIGGRKNVDLILLYYVVKYFKPQRILDLAAGLGETFCALYEARPEADITAVDFQLETQDFDRVYGNNKENITLVNQIPQEYETNDRYDFIRVESTCVDYQEQLDLFNKCKTLLSPGGILMIDDFYLAYTDKCISELFANDQEWIPFLSGPESLFIHNQSHDASAFLDQEIELLNKIASLYNENYKGSTVKTVKSSEVILDNDDIFKLICERYSL